MESSMLFFLPIIIILGIITSYEDFKKAKIRNKYLLAALSAGILVHVLLIILKIETFQNLTQQLLGTLLAFITGIFIWYIKWWSAGDAKLFTVYFFLIPLTTFKNPDITFRVMTLLINMVLPIWTFLLVRAIASHRKSIPKIIKHSLNARNILSILLLVLSIPWLVSIALAIFRIKSNFLISIAGMILISQWLRKYGIIEYIVYLAILIIRIAIEYTTFFEIDSLIMTVLWITAYFIVRHVILLLMVTNIHDKNKKIKRENKIVSWMIRDKGDIPFAPIMFLGVLLTLLIKESLDRIIISLII